MAAARRAPARRKTTTPRGPAPWWGDGAAPHVRWPGVTVDIPAVWAKDRARWESHAGRFYFDVEAADKACDFFPTFLTHHIGEFAGQSFYLLDYQRVLVRALFGWKQAATGLRRFRKVLLFVGKGGGKSPLGSGIGLFLALCDGEAGAEVYALASDKNQAKVVHNTAKVMVEQSADLAAMCEVTRDSIYYPAQRSFYQVLSADSKGKHGVRPHAAIVDELHAQPDRDLLEAIERSMAKRRQPVLVMLSHAGDDDESICFEEYQYAKGVIGGSVSDEGYYPMIFEAGPKDDWTIQETWRKANPTLGITVRVDGLAAGCQAAQNEPRKRNDFLRYHLNRWVGQATAWLPVEWWDACAGALEDAKLKTLRCCAGLDMAQKIDLVAFVVTFQEHLEGATPSVRVKVEGEDGTVAEREHSLNFRMYTRPYFWIPEQTVLDRAREGISYQAWADEGLLTITEGAAIDYDRVYKDITTKILPTYPLLKQGQVGYDPAFATDIANRLRDKAGLTTVEVLQNYKQFSEPCQVFEALVKSKRVVHDGHKVLRWNVENVAVKTDDAGRIRPVKPKKSGRKVDGVVASVMGLSRLMFAGEAAGPSVYEKRGMVVL